METNPAPTRKKISARRVGEVVVFTLAAAAFVVGPAAAVQVQHTTDAKVEQLNQEGTQPVKAAQVTIGALEADNVNLNFRMAALEQQNRALTERLDRLESQQP